jgi:hypothetical protein
VAKQSLHDFGIAVCNADMEFTYCNVGFPGSCHDARVLRQSDLCDSGLVLCKDNHSIADGAYSVRRMVANTLLKRQILCTIQQRVIMCTAVSTVAVPKLCSRLNLPLSNPKALSITTLFACRM